MITRSRTGLYLSYRDSALHNFTQEEDQRLLDDEVVIDLDKLPPQWVDITEKIDSILISTRNKILSLDKLHQKRLLPTFSDRSQEEQEIDSHTENITNDFRSCHSLMSSIQIKGTIDQVRISKNIQRAQATKIQELSGLFRKKQRIYLEKLKGHTIKDADILAASGKTHDNIQSLQDDEQLSQMQLNSTQLQLQDDAQLNKRDLEINNIAKSIAQLAELFRDLNTLVIDQGTMLDRIDFNAQGTKTQVDSAVKELNQATTYQRSSGKLKCIFLLILLIILIIVFIIYKPHMH